MKKMLIILISIIGLTTFNSCGKINDTIWVYYDETKCADPWETNENTSVKVKTKAIENYLENKGVKVFKVKINDDGTAEECKSCFCKTGSRIKCKINEDEIEKMKEEGFYQ